MKHQIEVRAVANFLPEQSEPEADRFTFAYTITITNQGEVPARLVARHWIITDGNNEVQEVKGQGVVGEQPLLNPGDSFEYTSGTVMPTPVGTMHGSYQMIGDDGSRFDAEIPMFSLAVSETLH